MHYQTRLLPIDHAGRFVAATTHGEHEVGGEDPRETGYAGIAAGHVDSPDLLADLSPVAFPLLRASPNRVAYMNDAARMQDQLVTSGRYTATQVESFRDNARQMRHAARLAATDRVRLPRRVLASRAGRIALGFDPAHPDTRGEALKGVLRVIDATDGSIAGEWASSRFPVDGPGRGIERYYNVQLGRPVAFSADGNSVILRNDMARRASVVACRLGDLFPQVGVASFGQGRIVAAGDGWIAFDDEAAQRWAPNLQAMAKVALPRGVLGWGACATADGTTLVVPTMHGGEFFVLGWDGAKPRRFASHRGARRDAMAKLAISDCGQWIASRCDRDVVVTRLADGMSWPVATLEDRRHEDRSYDGYVMRAHVPAGFGFVGSRLLVCDEAGVREVALEGSIGKPFVAEAGIAGARKPIVAKPSMRFDELMHAARLDAAADALRRLHSPAVAIQSKALGRSGWSMPHEPRAPELGASRFGGWPDLPEGTAWPTWRGRPMAFLGQIDLADVAAVQPDVRLPKEGLLHFFVGCIADTYDRDGDPRPRHLIDAMVGTEPDQGDGWRVLYTAAPDRLVRLAWAASPLPELVEPHAVRFTKGGAPLPDEQSAIYDQLPLDESQRDDYNELVAQLATAPEQWTEQLMGYPTLIQGTPPEVMCELAATGRNPYTFPTFGSTEAAALERAASEWTLLLQLTSQGPFEWGDGGHFYFYGDRRAMERGDFSKTWVNFET